MLWINKYGVSADFQETQLTFTIQMIQRLSYLFDSIALRSSFLSSLKIFHPILLKDSAFQSQFVWILCQGMLLLALVQFLYWRSFPCPWRRCVCCGLPCIWYKFYNFCFLVQNGKINVVNLPLTVSLGNCFAKSSLLPMEEEQWFGKML